MHIHINHCFCSDPCWGGEPYWSRYMVCIQQVVDYDHKDVDQLDPNNWEEDWNKLLEFRDIWDQKEYEKIKDRYKDDKFDVYAREHATLHKTPHLRQEVINWLNENVKDNEIDKDQPKGWCMGSDFYRGRDKHALTLWFYRRSDAMNFIRKWSSHKKPTTYFDYFKGIYKELVNGKLVKQ